MTHCYIITVYVCVCVYICTPTHIFTLTARMIEHTDAEQRISSFWGFVDKEIKWEGLAFGDGLFGAGTRGNDPSRERGSCKKSQHGTRSIQGICSISFTCGFSLRNQIADLAGRVKIGRRKMKNSVERTEYCSYWAVCHRWPGIPELLK